MTGDMNAEPKYPVFENIADAGGNKGTNSQLLVDSIVKGDQVKIHSFFPAVEKKQKSRGSMMKKKSDEGGARILMEKDGIKSHCTCSSDPIKFLFNKMIPYDHHMQKAGEEPFGFANGCLKTQKCLGLNDADMWNARVAALGVFPIFENSLLPETSPADGYGIVENSNFLFDEKR